MKNSNSTTVASAKRSEVHSDADKEDKIRDRAFELYEQRGREDGHELDDWLQAEAEVLQDKPRDSAA